MNTAMQQYIANLIAYSAAHSDGHPDPQGAINYLNQQLDLTLHIVGVALDDIDVILAGSRVAF